VLLACSAKMGAIMAQADEKQCQALYDYGYQLGMAFQVADDYLDAFGDAKVFGKPIGGDIINCKKSWLTVRTCEKLTGKEREAFLKRFNELVPEAENERKIAEIKKIYVDNGVDEDARAEVQRYTEEALKAARKLKLNKVRFEVLRRFAENLVGRAK